MGNEKIVLLASQKHCMACGNEGFEDRTCESCGREAKRINLHLMTEKSIQKFVAISKLRMIPEEYIANEWSSTVFWRNHESKRNRYLEDYVKKLEYVHDKFASGLLPRESGVIISPKGFSKSTWVFSCMQHALRHGFTVAPFLNTSEVQRLMAVSAENPNFKLYKEIEHDEYFMSDVLFMCVTKTEFKKYAYSVIMEVLDLRSRKGLTTFITSETPLEVIAAYDRSNNFKRMFTLYPDENLKKVPVFVQYKE